MAKKQTHRTSALWLALGLLGLALTQPLNATPTSGLSTEAVPFAFPNKLLDVPATLKSPVGQHVYIGRPQIVLEHTPAATLSQLTRTPLVRDGQGVFARDVMCVTGTEGAKPVIVWFISSDNKTVTETQIEWLNDRVVPPTCRALPAENLPVRLGKVGLGMTGDEVQELLGDPSLSDEDGWKYWFSQRFLRNQRNLQELELNWLSVHFDQEGRVDKAFVAQVTNL